MLSSIMIGIGALVGGAVLSPVIAFVVEVLDDINGLAKPSSSKPRRTR